MKKRFLALTLSLLLLLSAFVSCKSNAPSEDTSGSESFEADLSEYNIVYAKNASTATKKQAAALQAQLAEELSVQLTLETDDSADETGKEILLGITNREQSTEAYKKINGRGYAVAVDQNKIIITAYNDELISSASDYFFDTYVKGASGTVITLPSSLCYISELEDVSDVIKNGTSSYSIVRSDESTYHITKSAQELYNTISQSTGVELELKTDILGRGESADSESFEILIGDTNRPETQEVKESLKANEYAIRQVGNKIVVLGSSDATTVKAKDAFIGIIYDSLGQKIDGKRDLLIKTDSYKDAIGYTSRIVDVPQYSGGILEGVADCSDDTYEMLYTDTDTDEFNSYCQSLTAAGYTLYDKNQVNGNVYCSYFKSDEQLVYAYYTAYDNSVRIIVSPFNDGLLPLSFESSEKIADISVTQLRMDYAAGAGGMAYIITLEDGSFIVIDGGDNIGNNAAHLHEKLQELNKREGTPVIAAWILTHIHADHCGAFTRFAQAYGDQYILEYAIHNLPSKYIGDRNEDNKLSSYYASGSYSNTVNAFVGTAKTVRAHTGMRFNIHGAQFEVLYTWEDCYPASLEAQNDSSVVTRMTLAGQTFLWTGDVEKQGSNIIVSAYGDYVKCDYLQLAHHAWADGGSWDLYRTVSPSVAFWPCNDDLFEDKAQSTSPVGLLCASGCVKEHIVSGSGDRTIVLPYEFP